VGFDRLPVLLTFAVLGLAVNLVLFSALAWL
jgi:hypothetical protein